MTGFSPAIFTESERREVVKSLVASANAQSRKLRNLQAKLGPVDLTRHRQRRLDILEALRKLGADPAAEGVKPLPTNYRS